MSSKPNKKMEIGTNAVLPGAVADTITSDEGFKGNKYQRKIAASSVNSRATDYKKSSSSSNKLAPNEVSSSVSSNFSHNEVVASTFTSIAGSHSSNTSNGHHLSDAEGQYEVSSPDSEHVSMEMPQDNVR